MCWGVAVERSEERVMFVEEERMVEEAGDEDEGVRETELGDMVVEVPAVGGYLVTNLVPGSNGFGN